MVPNFTAGVFSQKLWRQVGDVDDCVVLAVIRCVNAVAGWLALPGNTAFRAAAGNPDDPTAADGLTLDQAMKAVKTLWPAVAVEKIAGGSWAPFIAKVKAGHCAMVFVLSAAMATKDGKAVRHAVSVYWNGSILRNVNPIREPFTIGTEISEAALRKAMGDYPDAGEVHAIVFPTVEEAFATHPLYVGPTDCAAKEKAAHDAGYAEARMAALAAVNAI